MREHVRKGMAAVAGILMVVGVLVAPATSAAEAATVASAPAVVRAAAVVGFDAGNIIDDGVFFAKGTMSAVQIQSFLNGKVPVCQAGYTCLKDFAQATNSRPADPMCAGYTGQARETAAQIVYNVAQSCNINPQVLLVTLQKEQGLVTHTWPSDWRYTIAMGQGCPDTAACDTRYYGFFNQVYGAARQMQRYSNPPGTSQYFTWYAPRATWNVQWHPNAGCGRGAVYIANQATANLYYYTPYQPNRAALNAGFGLGDACSSYGNRNFFNYFTAWFGSTHSLVGTAITDKYNALGGASSFLGAATSTVRCGLRDDGCYQEFQNGKIHWSRVSGAHATTGGIIVSWASTGWESGPLGYPTGEEFCGIAGGGCYQNFQNGQVHWSPSTGAQPSWGATFIKWAQLGYESSPLGYPTGQPMCTLRDGGCYQNYQNGKIHSSAKFGAHATWGPMAATWAALSYERGALGYPLNEPTCNLRDGGCYQSFEGGKIHWSSATGSQATTGAVLKLWASLSYERGALGYPTGAMTCTLRDGGCYQNFQSGRIHWSPKTGAHATWGPMGATWAALGFERGTLGYPLGEPFCTLRDGGCYQNFEKGRIHWSAATGAHATWGPIAETWAGLGFERGTLGYPLGEPTCTLRDGGCFQNFEQGKIHWSSSTGAFATTGAILAVWAKSGYERGSYGYPVAAEQCSADVCTQKFEGGTITTP